MVATVSVLAVCGSLRMWVLKRVQCKEHAHFCHVGREFGDIRERCWFHATKLLSFGRDCSRPDDVPQTLQHDGGNRRVCVRPPRGSARPAAARPACRRCPPRGRAGRALQRARRTQATATEAGLKAVPPRVPPSPEDPLLAWRTSDERKSFLGTPPRSEI